ncbi:MAG: LysR family transcriptional regulator [Oceanospirillaceae bacterium]
MRINLQQISAFVATAECGSFSAAARHLNRAQSAISNGVANLEIDFDLVLFDRSKREPRLTIAGQSLLPRAKQLLEQGRILQGHAKALAQNEEGKLVLAIEESLMGSDMYQLLARFEKTFPYLELELMFPVRHDVLDLIVKDRADIGLMLAIFRSPQDYKVTAMGEIQQSAVVSPEHPLAMGECAFDDLRYHRQLLLDSRGDESNEAEQMSSQIWRVESASSILLLVKQGLGWAWAPKYMVAEDVANKKLVELSFNGEQQHHHLPVDMITGNRYIEGNAGRWLYKQWLSLPFLH